MKLKGFKIDGVTYLVSPEQIEKAGSLENAAKEAKAKQDAKKQKPEPARAPRVKKTVETAQPEQD